MSENTPTPEELIETIDMTVEDATVIPIPIDPTLSIQGEAADAKATGDAISSAVGSLRVNGKAASSSAFTLYAGDINMSSSAGAQTVAEAIEDAAGRDADDIIYDSDEVISVKDALDDIYTSMDEGITDTEIDDILDEVFGEEE